eukprot:gene12788-12916_t
MAGFFDSQQQPSSEQLMRQLSGGFLLPELVLQSQPATNHATHRLAASADRLSLLGQSNKDFNECAQQEHPEGHHHQLNALGPLLLQQRLKSATARAPSGKAAQAAVCSSAASVGGDRLVWAKVSSDPTARDAAAAAPYGCPDGGAALLVRFLGTHDGAWLDRSRAVSPWDVARSERSSKTKASVILQALAEAKQFLATGELPKAFSTPLQLTSVASPQVAAAHKAKKQEAAYSRFKYMMTLAVGAALLVKALMLSQIMQQLCTPGQPCSGAVSGGPHVIHCALEVASSDVFADSKIFWSISSYVSCTEVMARMMVKDTTSGVEFPLAQRFWEGEESRCLGSGTRSKQILVVKVQVYTVALYVEAELAAKELGIRYRGGFFENDDDFCQALVDGAFAKTMVFQMLRDLEGQQFADAVKDKLGPRMSITGDTASLDAFMGYFEGQQLSKGTQVLCLWTKAGDLEVVLLPAESASSADLQTIAPKNRLRSEGFCRALFELFLGAQSVVSDAKPVWAAGAKELLESEQVKREARKAGSG